MSSDIAIQVKNISKCYQIYDQPQDRLKQAIVPRIQKTLGLPQKTYTREFWALNDVSFELKRGGSLGVLGLNGSGKSTLLQIICGTLSPSSGSIAINGRIAALLELGAGFNPEFTGLENVYLNGSVLGLSNQQITTQLENILEFADIGDFINQPVKTYSSGMYVRLAFSVAIHSNPDILVVDEALAVGDFLFQQKCNLFMKENLSEVTKLFVSHDISAIANMTETAIVLNRGRLVYFGDVQSAIQEYQISSRAILGSKESPKSNVVSQKVECLPEVNNVHNNVLSGVFVDIPTSSLSGTLDSVIQSFSWSVDGKQGGSLVRTGDLVTFSIVIKSDNDILSPIIGYQIQDRFGTVIFGENSTSSGIDVSSIPRGQIILTMDMQWPEVSSGKYSITMGVGSGSDSEAHVVVCWAHNIIVVDSVSNRPVHGIFNNRLLRLEVIRNAFE